MATLLQQNEIYKEEYKHAYDDMVTSINVVNGNTSRAMLVVASVRGTDQTLQEVVGALDRAKLATERAEEAIRDGEVACAQMIVSQTKVYDTIKAGIALAIGQNIGILKRSLLIIIILRRQKTQL